MCEYCESEEPKGIISDPYNVLMIQGNELYFLSQEGEDDYELSGRINFCPMCGRNLTETDSSIDAIDKLFPHMREQPKEVPAATAEDLKTLHQSCLHRMKALINDDDKEEAHIKADRILCKILHAIGFHDVVEAFNEIDKWYA